jgi:2,5-dioxopentanoate dehydrogenase
MDEYRGHDIAGQASAEGPVTDAGYPEATAAEIDRACRAAAEAAGAYRARPVEARAGFLERIADELETEADRLAETIPAETALPEARARGELARTTGQLRLFAEVVRRGDYLGARIDHADAQRTPPRPDLRQYRVPFGPVAVFGASNFPLAFSVAGGDTASALAAGCPVVFKAHPGHPLTSAVVGAALRRAVAAADMPAGVFSLLYGAGNAVGGALVEHPAIQAVAFTGSFAGGTALARLAQVRPEPIPVYAEMGSVNPLFLLPGALERDSEELAQAYFASLTLGVGQFCTNPGLVFAVRGSALERFCSALGAAAKEQAAQPMLHAGILAAYETGTQRLSGAGGVQAIATGAEADGRAAAHVYRVSGETFAANPQLAEEVFGPSGLIVELDGLDQMAAIVRALPGQLTATLHGTAEELPAQAELIGALERRVGRVLFNGFPTGVEVCDAMVHGGPWPATTAAQTTSVGTLAIERFVRPVCYQDCPEALLPEALREHNPLGLRRLVNGAWQAPVT